VDVLEKNAIAFYERRGLPLIHSVVSSNHFSGLEVNIYLIKCFSFYQVEVKKRNK
jgi:hypothetical protein